MNDIGVIKRRKEANFLLESIKEIGFGQEFPGDNFASKESERHRMTDKNDDSGGPFAQGFDVFVTAEPLRDVQDVAVVHGHFQDIGGNIHVLNEVIGRGYLGIGCLELDGNGNVGLKVERGEKGKLESGGSERKLEKREENWGTIGGAV
jgi:hypothetical protein